MMLEPLLEPSHTFIWTAPVLFLYIIEWLYVIGLSFSYDQ